MQPSVDEEWAKFCEDEEGFIPENNVIIDHKNTEIPKCSDIYISTKTKIAYLNSKIPLQEVFWQVPVIKYYISDK